MRYFLLVIGLLFLQLPAVAEDTKKPHFLGNYASEKEYTTAFNQGLRKSQQIKKESAKRQGKIDWIIFVSSIFALMAPVVLATIRKEPSQVIFYHFLVVFPLLISICSLFPVMVALGEWGSMKHPSLHNLFSNLELNLLIFKANIYLIPIASGFIYLFLFMVKKIRKAEIIISLSIYFFMYSGFMVFLNIMSGLASQGAGH
ncbi:MAG: hypothetical protein JAY90_08005 [Candidatus Thiodiazotropha lotti]|nr:hypothetical protein [Candidatus Thiodiazotropha lotti]